MFFIKKVFSRVLNLFITNLNSHIMAVELTNHLALLYFPFCTKDQARRNFTLLIRNNPALKHELEEIGWTTDRRFLTPRQIEIIEKYIGVP